MTKLNLGDINEKIPLQKAIYLGIQHVLAMDLYIVPIILAGILAFNTQDSAALIQMTFIVAGIATLIQSGFSLKLPVMQGPSYIPLGAIGALGKSYGMAAVYGALIPVGIAIFLLGKPLNKFSQLVRKFVPPIVGGTVIVIVGISLIPVAFSGIYTGPTPLDNMAVAGASAALLTGFILIGCFIKAAHWMRLTSVLLSMVFGTLVASQYGMVDFSSVADAPWFALPELMPFGTPEFHLVPIATMMFIALIVLIETTGTWCAVSAVTGAELTDEKVNAGANGEGIGYFICSLFGGSPVTGYSTNAGIIAVTGVASRRAIMAGGGVLLLFGFMPKLMYVIASIPHPVISGVFAIICVIIAMNGFRVIQHIQLNERNMLVIGIPILVSLGTAVMPREILYSMPQLASYLLSSGIAIGAILAVLMNALIPNEKTAGEVTE